MNSKKSALVFSTILLLGSLSAWAQLAPSASSADDLIGLQQAGINEAVIRYIAGSAGVPAEPPGYGYPYAYGYGYANPYPYGYRHYPSFSGRFIRGRGFGGLEFFGGRVYFGGGGRFGGRGHFGAGFSGWGHGGIGYP